MSFDAPIPLSDIESVLAWVDTFKLSRPTKKINRDFSDAVLLAEMLSVNYPKLVEMHNYPPRNGHALKLNNWMTLNRKVLKKLKLNLCISTMEQLANCAPGVIERVLIMVREKIRRDEDANKTKDENEQNLSSGGSYYEACGDDEHVLVVPVKTRVNGVLETIQQKVVSYEAYLALKQELKDAKDCRELLKNKVDHLDNLLKLKEERINELQKQLERKQARRKETEALQNSLSVPFDTVPPTPRNSDMIHVSSKLMLKPVESISKIPKLEDSRSKGDDPKLSKSEEFKIIQSEDKVLFRVDDSTNSFRESTKADDSKISFRDSITIKSSAMSKPSLTEVHTIASDVVNTIQFEVNRMKTEVFKEIEIIEQKSDDYLDVDEFKDSEDETLVTIEDSIQKEIKEISNPMEFANDMHFKL